MQRISGPADQRISGSADQRSSGSAQRTSRSADQRQWISPGEHRITTDHARIRRATNACNSCRNCENGLRKNRSCSKCYAMDCFGKYFTVSTPVITFVFKVLRSGLLRQILYTCPNLSYHWCSSATQWTASVHRIYTCPNL